MAKLVKTVTSVLVSKGQQLPVMVTLVVMVFGIICSANSVMGSSWMVVGPNMSSMVPGMSTSDKANSMPRDHCQNVTECGSNYVQHKLLGNLVIGSLVLGTVLSLLLFLLKVKERYRFSRQVPINFFFGAKFITKTRLVTALNHLVVKVFDSFKYALSRGLVHPQLYN